MNLVISFAGDALVCIFRCGEGSGLPPEASTKRALTCAFQLKDHYTETLTAHIAISYGQMSFATLGGHRNEWTYLLNGECISELSSCLDDAGSREIVTTEGFFQAISSVLTPEERVMAYQNRHKNRLFKKYKSAGYEKESVLRFNLFSTSTEFLSQAKLFVPRPALDAIEVGTFSSLAELREVTTLFLKLDSYSSELHKDPVSLQDFFVVVQNRLHEQGGFMRQFLIDDKGCVFIGMWGVPSLAYTNNCSRALVCAVGIERSCGSLGHHVSIGITTGGVFCGNIGSDLRRDFVGIGATVNLAARFMSKAEGCILIDELTYGRLPDDKKALLSRSYGMDLKGVTGKIYPYFYVGDGDILQTNPQEEDQQSIGLVMRKQVADAFKIVLDTVINYKNLAGNAVSNAATGNRILRTPSKSLADAQKAHARRNSELQRLGARQDDRNKSREDRIPSALYNRLGAGELGGETRNSLFRNVGGENDRTSVRRKNSILGRVFTVDQQEVNNGEDTVFLVNCVVIEGAPGMGRATAARHFKDLAKKAGLRVVAVSSRIGDEAVSFGLIKSLVTHLIGEERFHDEPQQRNALLEALITISPNLDMSLYSQELFDLSLLLGLDWKPASKKEDTHQIRRATSTAVTNKNASRVVVEIVKYLILKEPTALVIENAHHLDTLSWNSLRMLLQCNLQVAVLLTLQSGYNDKLLNNASLSEKLKFNSKPDEMSPTSELYTELTSNPRCELVRLLSLNQDEVGDILIARVKNNVTITKELVNLVLEASSGNPYWCESIAQYINERGDKEFKEAMQSNQSGGVSNALSTLVVSKLSILKQEEQLIIKFASAIGEEFSEIVLDAVIPERFRLNLKTHINSLISFGFLKQRSDSSDKDILCFQNSRIKNIIYEMLPPREAAKTHLDIARFIECSEANLKPYYPL